MACPAMMRGAGPPTQLPSCRQCRFYCINPHTAALLLSLRLSLRQLLSLDSLNPMQARNCRLSDPLSLAIAVYSQILLKSAVWRHSFCFIHLSPQHFSLPAPCASLAGPKDPQPGAPPLPGAACRHCVVRSPSTGPAYHLRQALKCCASAVLACLMSR